MKKFILIIFVSLLVFMLLSCAQKADKPDTEDIRELLRNISDSPFGMTIEAADENIFVENAAKNDLGFQIRLQDPEVSLSSEIYKKLEIPFPDFKFPLEVKQMTLHHNPGRGFLSLDSMQGISLPFDPEFFKALKNWNKEESSEDSKFPNIRFSVEEIQWGRFDISSLINSKDRNILDLLIDLTEANPKSDLTAKGYKIEIQDAEDMEKMVISVRQASVRSVMPAGLIKAFFHSDTAADTILQILKEEKSLIEFVYEIQGGEFDLDSKGSKIHAGIENLTWDYYARAGQNQDTVDAGYSVRFGGIQTQGIPDKKVQLLTNLKNLQYEFIFQGMPTDFIASYIEFIQFAQKAGASQDITLTQQMGMKGMAMVGQLIQAKPSLVLRDFTMEHELGTLLAEGEFQFVGMGLPVGKGTLKISSLEKIAAQLVEEGILSQSDTDDFLAKIKGFMKIESDGSAGLEVEIKPDDPKHIYLNGIPMPIKK